MLRQVQYYHLFTFPITKISLDALANKPYTERNSIRGELTLLIFSTLEIHFLLLKMSFVKVLMSLCGVLEKKVAPMQKFSRLILLIFLLFFSLTILCSAEEGASYQGIFSTIWGDDAILVNSQERYFLFREKDETLELLIPEEVLQDAGGVSSLIGKSVTIVARQYNSTAFRNGRNAVSVSEISLNPHELQNDTVEFAATGSQPWVSLMCKFSDIADEPKDINYFSGMYSSSKPGLDHYWREVSYNIVNVNGSSAVGWYTLPHDRDYYVYDMNGDLKVDLDIDRITNDCVNAANEDVYFPSFVGINMMFNAELDGYAWGEQRQSISMVNTRHIEQPGNPLGVMMI